jgi:hypothetical protein
MKYRRDIIYVGLSLLVGISLAAIMTEATYRFQTRAQDRSQKQITLIIPQGTAKLVEQGQPSPSIPKDMVFVVGDELLVKNEDVVDHQLGPLFIPKGSSAALKFNQVENLAYACTFSPEKYLGFDVKAPLTIYTRIMGILSAGVPMGTLIALYVVFAIRPGLMKEKEKK